MGFGARLNRSAKVVGFQSRCHAGKADRADASASISLPTFMLKRGDRPTLDSLALMSLSAGDKLGPYEILAPIGAGGMGEVYRAQDSRLRRDVAIKILPEAIARGDAWARFEREARAASALSHPNICAVYDVGEADGRPFLVMELLEGKTLRDYVGEHPAEPNTAIALGSQVADALEAAHAKGILHRDIKPANIMVIGRGHVKVLDFGLAKQIAPESAAETRTLESLTAAGTLMGTPQVHVSGDSARETRRCS